MAEDRPAWQQDIRSLKRSMRALERRVCSLESERSGLPPLPAGAPAGSSAADQEDLPEAFIAGVAKAPAYVGRLLLVLGGGYLIRAFSGVEDVPALAGAVAGLVYGLAWLALAERAARAGRAYAAEWHGIAAAAIVFPLLWETAARFEIISYLAAAALLTGCTLAAHWIAVRRSLATLPAVFALGAGVCGLALMVSGGGAAVPVSTVLFGLGLVGIVLGRRHGLSTPMMIAAGVADAAAILLAIGAVRGSGAPAAIAILLLALLFTGYVLAIATGALAGRRSLDAFDWSQTGGVLLLGFGGAMFVARKTGAHELILGLGAVVLAVGLYLLAFTVLDRERRRMFQYLTTIAIVLVLSASASLLPRPVLPWTLLAVATTATARRFGRVTLGTHAGIYALAATLAAGVLVEAPAWWSQLSGSLPTNLAPWLAGGALLVVGAVRVQSTREATARTGDAMRALILVLLVAVMGGLVLRASTLPVAAGVSLGWQAAVRTVTIALLSLGCAALGRRTGYRILGRVAPVLLAVGAVKLLFEDMAVGQAVTLALSFSAFGVALILMPRLLRQRSPAA